MGRNQIQHRTEIRAGRSRRQSFANAAVFGENFPADGDFERALSPEGEYATGYSSEEHGRNEDVGVEDDPHRERTALIAAETSDLRRPASRAARRAFAMRESNSSSEGAVIGRSTIASALFATTNRTPAFRRIRRRMDSGMTTCPLEDSFVVVTSFMR